MEGLGVSGGRCREKVIEFFHQLSGKPNSAPRVMQLICRIEHFPVPVKLMLQFRNCRIPAQTGPGGLPLALRLSEGSGLG